MTESPETIEHVANETSETPESVETPELSNAPAPQNAAEGKTPSAPLNSAEDIAAALKESDECGDDADLADADRADAEGVGRENRETAAPESWTEEEKTVFAQLPEAARQIIAKRDEEHTRVATARTWEAAQARRISERLFQHVDGTLGEGVLCAQLAVELDFAGVDWARLQAADPRAFMELDGMRRQRTQALEKALAVQKELEQARVAQEAAEVGRTIAEEVPSFVDEVERMVPGVNGERFLRDLGAYLDEAGVPQAHRKDITRGYQLMLAAKAMLYDRGKKARETAAAKVAAAPRIQGPKARSAMDGGGVNPKAARERIRKGGSGTENIAEALKSLGF